MNSVAPSRRDRARSPAASSAGSAKRSSKPRPVRAAGQGRVTGSSIAMGAPAGVAVGQPNADELYLKPGDVVEVAIEGFAPLRTRIIDEQPT